MTRKGVKATRESTTQRKSIPTQSNIYAEAIVVTITQLFDFFLGGGIEQQSSFKQIFFQLKEWYSSWHKSSPGGYIV